MKFSEEFPGKYLKAADIAPHNPPVTVTMTNVDREQVKNKQGTETVLVLYFAEFEKGMILKKINGKVIAAKYGDNMDDWEGHQIDLLIREQEFGGEVYEVIRVQIPKAIIKPLNKPATKAS